MRTSIVDDHPNIWLVYPHTKCHCCDDTLKGGNVCICGGGVGGIMQACPDKLKVVY